MSFTSPELTESESAAAQEHGEAYVLAVVDFYGGDQRRICVFSPGRCNARTSIKASP